MTILTACQKAAVKLLGGGGRPSELFASTEEFEIELRTLANETAREAAKAHDWRKLTTLKTQVGDGSSTSFDLPSDYDRMLLKGKVWSSAHDTPLTPARDLDEWLYMSLTSITGDPGFWVILGGDLQVMPAPASTESLKYYYQSNLLWSTGAGIAASKTEATADTDVCVICERLIELGVVWRWKLLKGKEYAEDLRNYELAFGEEAGRDKGSRVLAIGRPRIASGLVAAYPGTITA